MLHLNRFAFEIKMNQFNIGFAFQIVFASIQCCIAEFYIIYKLKGSQEHVHS